MHESNRYKPLPFPGISPQSPSASGLQTATILTNILTLIKMNSSNIDTLLRDEKHPAYTTLLHLTNDIDTKDPTEQDRQTRAIALAIAQKIGTNTQPLPIRIAGTNHHYPDISLIAAATLYEKDYNGYHTAIITTLSNWDSLFEKIISCIGKTPLPYVLPFTLCTASLAWTAIENMSLSAPFKGEISMINFLSPILAYMTYAKKGHLESLLDNSLLLISTLLPKPAFACYFGRAICGNTDIDPFTSCAVTTIIASSCGLLPAIVTGITALTILSSYLSADSYAHKIMDTQRSPSIYNYMEFSKATGSSFSTPLKSYDSSPFSTPPRS